MSKQRHVENKRAHFDYEILEDLEAGLVLTGEEVKAFRAGKVTIGAAFVRPLQSAPNKDAELWLINAQFAGVSEPDRSRKLLVHRKEVDRFIGKVQEKSLTLVPIEMYLNKGKVKLRIGLAKGKKKFEKRETIKKRDVERELKRSIKG